MRKSHLAVGPIVAVISSLSLVACGGSGTGPTSIGSSSAACTPKHQFTTITKGVLTVAATDYRPFAWVEGDKVLGPDADILHAFAKAECLTVSIQAVSYAAAIPAVQSGRADVATGAYYRTEKRAAAVGLSEPTYIDQSVIVSKDGITDYQKFKGMKVGTTQGQLWVSDLQKLVGDSLKTYPDSVNTYQDLIAGRTDVVIDGYGSAVYSLQKLNASNKYQIKIGSADPAMQSSLQPAQCGIPYTKTNTALGTALNDTVKSLKSDGDMGKFLKSVGIDPSAADTGPARIIKS